MLKKIIFFIFSLFIFQIQSKGIVICTVSDELYFDPLLNFIGSIHKVNFDELEEIMVFNLSMTNEQIEKLNRIEKLKIYSIEKVHPKLLKPVIIDVHGKSVRGWYAWKPVIIKQALEKYESILYMDAGNTILKPLNDLFSHIEQNGYFFLAGPHNIRDWITKRVINYFDLESEERKFILDPARKSISANIIGISRNYYNNLVLPMYNHAKDLTLFEDDGTAPGGFGKHRHDQTLFSIYTCLLNLKLNTQGYSMLNVNGKKVVFNTHFYPHMINNKSVIYQSRWDLGYGGKRTENDEPYFAQFIHYKNEDDNEI